MNLMSALSAWGSNLAPKPKSWISSMRVLIPISLDLYYIVPLCVRREIAAETTPGKEVRWPSMVFWHAEQVIPAMIRVQDLMVFT